MRSPLRDPIPGDVVHKIDARGNVIRREIAVVGKSFGKKRLLYRRDDGGSRGMLISTWREWCRTAEVVKRGDE